MATVFLNGAFVEAKDAAVSAFDAGLTHGVGLFETMLGGCSEEGKPWVFMLGDHMERLARSAAVLGLSTELRKDALGDAVLETVRRSGLGRARVRLTVTGGMLGAPGRDGGGGGGDPTVLIVAQGATEYPALMFERGVAVTIADARANPLSPIEGHKTLSYWWRLRELRAAGARGAAEALVLSVTNHVCGGCVSNVWLVRGGELITPIARGEEGGNGTSQMANGKSDQEQREQGRRSGGFLPSPVLAGITRLWVMGEAERMGMRVRREMISVAEVLGADEVFLTNSSWGILPVVKVEASAIGDAAPGKVAGSLRGAWEAAVGAAARG